jgi:hypothetical protein
VGEKIRDHIRSNVVGYVAVFLALSGTAYAVDGPLAGQNTVGSADIINGEVTNNDLGADSVASGKIQDRQVKNADLSIAASSSNTIADGGIQGIDVMNETLTGDDVQESSLDLPLLALIEGDDGTLVRGRGVTGAFKFCPGFACPPDPFVGYEIVFNRDVGNCWYYATIADKLGGRGSEAPPGEIGVRPLSTNSQGVSVTTFDSTGNPADRDFFLAVFC